MKCFPLATFAAMLLGLSTTFACAAGGKAVIDPAEAGPDFKVQGEYAGAVQSEDADDQWGAQVIALGAGKFDAVGYRGGLPGDGWDGSEKQRASGQREGHTTTLKCDEDELVLTINDGAITITNSAGDKLGTLKKVHRESKTLGAKAPAGATVLFDGNSTDHWAKGKLEDGLLMQGALSKFEHQDAKIHLEFRLPFMPDARGQARGNSGLYVQGCYEIQMLDSFGLEGADNECGGIYKASKPKLNMCYPPLAWQTYDIEFTAPEFDDQGKKTASARMTVKHNGVLIHDDLEIPGTTPGGVRGEGPKPGPVYLQDHGNPVRYRNIWVVEKQ